jgi:hypothetical protein
MVGKINTFITFTTQVFVDLKPTILKGQQPDSHSGTGTEKIKCLTS